MMKRDMAAAAGRALLAATAVAALLLLAGCTEPPTQQTTQAAAEPPSGPAPDSVPAPAPEDLGVTPVSPNALYARLAIAEGASGVMVVMLDESGGAGSGYDTLYADIDLDGRLTTEGERLEATESEDYGQVSIAQFPPIDLGDGVNGADAGRRLTLYYMGYPEGDEQSLRASIMLPPLDDTEHDARMAMLSGELALAATPAEAPVWRAFGEAVLEMKTEPSSDRQLCIAVTARIGDAELYAPEAEVDLVVRTADGQVLSRDHGYLSDFGFG